MILIEIHILIRKFCAAIANIMKKDTLVRGANVFILGKQDNPRPALRRTNIGRGGRMLKKFLVWFWFRQDPNYKDKRFPTRIVKVKGWRTFLMDNHVNKTERSMVSIILPWEKYGKWRKS